MTIGSAADQIIRELGYDSVDKRLDRRNVIKRMDAVRSEMMSVLANNGSIQGDQYLIRINVTPSELPDIFYVSREADILLDEVRKKYYSNMPSEYVSFYSNNGIRVIKPVQADSGSHYFINQKAGASVLYGSLESAALGGKVGYEVEGQKVYYNNLSPNTYTKVLITYIPSLSGLREDDEMPMTGELISLLLTKTRDSFIIQKSVPEDKVVDSRSN
jgi:hypothetical protein